jgi:hypothetical protein
MHSRKKSGALRPTTPVFEVLTFIAVTFVLLESPPLGFQECQATRLFQRILPCSFAFGILHKLPLKTAHFVVDPHGY